MKKQSRYLNTIELDKYIRQIQLGDLIEYTRSRITKNITKIDIARIYLVLDVPKYSCSSATFTINVLRCGSSNEIENSSKVVSNLHFYYENDHKTMQKYFHDSEHSDVMMKTLFRLN